MGEYGIEVRKTLGQLLLWAVFVCVSAWFSGQTSRIPGFLTGLFTAMIYFALLSHRIRRSADMPVAKAITYMRIGWMLRLLFIVLMLYLSVHLPWLDFWSAVIGLFSLYFVMLYNALIRLLQYKNVKRKEGG